MPKTEKRHVRSLSDEEEARLQEAIARDPDAAEATDEALAAMRPASEVLPKLLYAKLVQRGRPKSAETKTAVQLRLDPEIVEALPREDTSLSATSTTGETPPCGSVAAACASMELTRVCHPLPVLLKGKGGAEERDAEASRS